MHLWFWAAYLRATHTPGISALQLQRQLGINQNATVWFMLHRLRKGMIRPGRALLHGVVEAEETHIGGPAKGKKGRGVRVAASKTWIVGAVEIMSFKNKKGALKEKAGRIRLETRRSASEENIGKFLQEKVVSGSTIKSDGWRGYSESALKGDEHIRQVQGPPERAKERAPHIHSVFSNLQSWLIGIHHGVDPKYLQAYLDEYVFRFNRRGTPLAAFQTLLGIASSKKPVLRSHLLKP